MLIYNIQPYISINHSLERILVSLYPKVSHTVYMDLTKSKEKKDYTYIKNVLDKVISTF